MNAASTTSSFVPTLPGEPSPSSSSSSSSADRGDARSPPLSAARFVHRRLRVVTEPKHSNKMHRTRTLSELMLVSSPRSSPRVTPRHKRLDMDIEVSRFVAEGDGLVDLWGSRCRRPCARPSVVDESTTPSPRTTFFPSPQQQPLEAMDVDDDDDDDEPEAEPEAEPPHSVSDVVDMLFAIHSALKSRHLGQRTAASALAASNLVSTLAYPALPEPMPRDEQLQALEHTRKMLECAICQEIFTHATEATCCGQIFCKECIERWVSERGSCPMCRQSMGFALLVASRHAQRMANEIKVTCVYCSESMKKAALADHVRACTHAPVEPPPPADRALRDLLVRTARRSRTCLARFLMASSPPQARMMQCYIRTRGGGTYELYTQHTDTLLCTAVRRRQYDMSVSFLISLATNLDAPRASDATNHNATYPLNAAVPVARLDKNYMGSQYTMYDTTGDVPVELGAVQYAATFGKSPRQMRVVLPLVAPIPGVDSAVDGSPSWAVQPWRPATKEDTMLAQVDHPDPTRALHLLNKPPVWIESLEAYCLDFGGRVAAASVKNFLLAHPHDMDETLLLFGRTEDRQVYSMDYAHPFTPVQAFAIALSSMDSHLVTFD
ncbi:hypothetical protein PsorP6_010877 [Peronosclerospora sorghi]|uniref:Uncharacterized protein n=1 Tax=Peronosclerospora sorghi TaxID=230839 RepID=A0ACC0VXH4_9STRA|nr:hypothetical protein PsorP6_010877 [Peronosclerospora sorghi]